MERCSVITNKSNSCRGLEFNSKSPWSIYLYFQFQGTWWHLLDPIGIWTHIYNLILHTCTHNLKKKKRRITKEARCEGKSNNEAPISHISLLECWMSKTNGKVRKNEVNRNPGTVCRNTKHRFPFPLTMKLFPAGKWTLHILLWFSWEPR